MAQEREWEANTGNEILDNLIDEHVREAVRYLIGSISFHLSLREGRLRIEAIADWAYMEEGIEETLYAGADLAQVVREGADMYRPIKPEFTDAAKELAEYQAAIAALRDAAL